MPYAAKLANGQSLTEGGIGVPANLNTIPLLLDVPFSATGEITNTPSPDSTLACPLHAFGKAEFPDIWTTNTIWFDVEFKGTEDVNAIVVCSSFALGLTLTFPFKPWRFNLTFCCAARSADIVSVIPQTATSIALNIFIFALFSVFSFQSKHAKC